MKEVIKNKWILVFAIMVIGVFYIGADDPKSFEEPNNNPKVEVNI